MENSKEIMNELEPVNESDYDSEGWHKGIEDTARELYFKIKNKLKEDK